MPPILSTPSLAAPAAGSALLLPPRANWLLPAALLFLLLLVGRWVQPLAAVLTLRQAGPTATELLRQPSALGRSTELSRPTRLPLPTAATALPRAL